MMQQGGQAPSLEGDTALSAQAAAYRNARNRSSDRQRATLAERSAFQGTNYGGAGSGSFDTGLMGIEEAGGRDIAGYEANLVGQEVQAKRAQLMQALNMANSVGARTEAAQIQQQLAMLQAQLSREGMAQQQTQFGDDLGYRYANMETGLNRDMLIAAMGGYS
jgi:hypothetical protein